MLDFLWQGYGCPGLSILSHALVGAEIARVDASCCTFALVHSSLCMSTIGTLRSSLNTSLVINFMLRSLVFGWDYTPENILECSGSIFIKLYFSGMLGNEEQKQKYLPSLARFDTIGCWVSLCGPL